MHIKVRVRANVRKEAFEKVSGGSFRISVKEKAEGNAANRRVLALIAAHFRVSQKAVRVINGHHAPSKLLEIREVY